MSDTRHRRHLIALGLLMTPALPEKVGGGATPAAASAEDALILQLEPVRI